MGTLYSKKKQQKQCPDAFELAVTGYLRIFIKNTSIYIPKEIQYLCLDYYRIKHLIIQKNETMQLFCSKYHAPYIFDQITIKKNGILTVNGWDTNTESGGTLCITCKGKITLKMGASINLNGKGYYGGYNGMSGESYMGLSKHQDTPNYGGGGGYKDSEYKWEHQYAGGGGYGTKGIQFGNNEGNENVYLGGNKYGTIDLKVLYLGSGGGSYMTKKGVAGYGGNGGGALRIKCFGILKMGRCAKISCDGAVAYSYESGCGSGGSIHIILNDYDDLKMHETSCIQAIGGMKGKYNSNGGKGRICFQAIQKKTKQHIDLTKYVFNPEPYLSYFKGSI